MQPLRAALTLAAALAVLAPSLANAVTWVKAGDVGRVAVWVDKDSIRRTGTQARATLEWRWLQPTELPGAEAGKSYRMERQVQIANCENRGYAVPEGTHYADERGTDAVGSYKHDESTLPYFVAPARTIREAAVLFVCQASLQQPAKK